MGASGRGSSGSTQGKALMWERHLAKAQAQPFLMTQRLRAVASPSPTST